MGLTPRGGVLLSLLLLAGCGGGPPALAGVWQPDDGSAVKTILEDGTCSGMYYADGRPLDIGGSATCVLGSEGAGGGYPLVVEQPPNRASYDVTFDGEDTMVLDTGAGTVTLTRR